MTLDYENPRKGAPEKSDEHVSGHCTVQCTRRYMSLHKEVFLGAATKVRVRGTGAPMCQSSTSVRANPSGIRKVPGQMGSCGDDNSKAK